MRPGEDPRCPVTEVLQHPYGMSQEWVAWATPIVGGGVHRGCQQFLKSSRGGQAKAANARRRRERERWMPVVGQVRVTVLLDHAQEEGIIW